MRGNYNNMFEEKSSVNVTPNFEEVKKRFTQIYELKKELGQIDGLKIAQNLFLFFCFFFFGYWFAFWVIGSEKGEVLSFFLTTIHIICYIVYTFDGGINFNLDMFKYDIGITFWKCAENALPEEFRNIIWISFFVSLCVNTFLFTCVNGLDAYITHGEVLKYFFTTCLITFLVYLYIALFKVTKALIFKANK